VSKKGNPTGHIVVALATGISIVVMAYASKRLMTEPIRDLWLGIPPFIMVLYEGVQSHPKTVRLRRTPVSVWVIAIFVATAAVVGLTWN